MIPRDSILCHFCSYNIDENLVDFVLECSFYNSIRERFVSIS